VRVIIPLKGEVYNWIRAIVFSRPPRHRLLPVIPAQAAIHEAAGKPRKAGFPLAREWRGI